MLPEVFSSLLSRGFLSSGPPTGGFGQDFSLPAMIRLSSSRVGNSLDFSQLINELSTENRTAVSPMELAGKSGVHHEFAFAVTAKDGRAQLVVDVALSSSEVDETKVLAFFIKVFDVQSKHAILCVSPRLNSRGEMLAKQYGIVVLQNRDSAKLTSMLSRASRRILGR